METASGAFICQAVSVAGSSTADLFGIRSRRSLDWSGRFAFNAWGSIFTLLSLAPLVYAPWHKAAEP